MPGLIYRRRNSSAVGEIQVEDGVQAIFLISGNLCEREVEKLRGQRLILA